MNKNKLIWSVELFLIFIVSLPLAYAQIPTGSRLFFILINAAIVFVVLFILQSFLVPGKEGKEKTAMWVIIAIASLLVAFLYGQSGFIWQGPLGIFFNIKVLVNAAIIAAVIYFLIGVTPIGKNLKLDSTPGKTGYGLLIFLLSVIFAVQLGNNWIWSLSTVQLFISYLFGETGILNPKAPEYRLWVFISSATLIAFFFNHWLIKEAQNKWLNYSLAILIASNLASAGTSLGSVIQLGEVFFLLILADALRTSLGETNIIRRYLVSFILVGWASAAITAGYPEYQGWLAWWFGKLNPFAAIKWAFLAGAAEEVGIGVLIIVALLVGLFLFGKFTGHEGLTSKAGKFLLIGVVILGLLFGVSLLPLVILLVILLGGIGYAVTRGENRKRILTLGLTNLKKRLNAIMKSAKFLRETPEGREPAVFVENRVLFHTLANFTTRSEITYRYWGFVKQAKRIGTSVLEGTNALKIKIGTFLDQKALRKDIIVTRSGGVTSEGAHFGGWNRLNLAAVDLVNEFFEKLYWASVAAVLNFKPAAAFEREKRVFISIQSRAHDLLVKLEDNREQYKIRADAFRGHHVLNAYRGIILNMTNVTGDVLEHPQKFARPGAEFDMGDQTNKPMYAGKDVRGFPIDEVNQFGEVIADIVEQKDKFGNLPDPRDYQKPRKLKNPNDIIDYPDYTTLMANIELDWKGLAEDVRYGLWHPESRTKQMYIDALRKAVYPEWADDEIPVEIEGSKMTTPPSTGDEAFDMRALANPSLHTYWGRTTFSQLAESPPGKQDPYHNPFPALSSLGIAKYLAERVRLDMKNRALAEEFLNRYPADTGAAEKVIVRGEVKVKIGTRLGVATQQQGQQQQP